jgi:heme-degrading monooxygenase HmoA
VIRHIFMGTAQEGVTPEQIEELLNAWRTFPSQIAEVRNLTAGRNISPRDQRYTVALVADFDDMDAWQRYMDHPAHLAVSQRLTSHIIRADSRAIIQISVEGK